jgi:hypothetical protein
LNTSVMTGLLLVSGLGVGAYLLWRLYQKQRGTETTSQSRIEVAVPPLKAPKAAKK